MENLTHVQNILTKKKIDKARSFASYDAKINVIGSYDQPTMALMSALQNASSYFNKELFNNSLSPVILTLNRNARSWRYYMPLAWSNESGDNIPEINISPSILQLPPDEVMGTLVHEMAHHFHELFGTPGQGGYHNKEFSRIMFAVGLMTSATGRPGGKPMGRSMSHYIIEGGRFEEALKSMPKEYLLPFKSFPLRKKLRHVSANKNKLKYQCESCNAAAWGKPNLNIRCEDCNITMSLIIKF
jgi:predicted SprT family Zn-dependent metalloprotease